MTPSLDLSRYRNMAGEGKRQIDNLSAWTKNKDTMSEKVRMFVLNGTLLNVLTNSLQPMPLSFENSLPAAVLGFGNTNEDGVPFSCHLYSCATMNTGNSHLHQWIVTKFLHIVDSYKQIDDANPSSPITLDCTVPASEAKQPT